MKPQSAAAASDASPEAVAEVAAAASAAATENMAPQIARKVHSEAIKENSSTESFIVRYKTDTTERKDVNAVQSKLNRLAAAFPAKARHQRRMGIGADVVTTERKLNAKEARAFMRAIASDPNVEYVEPDTEMQAQGVPNDPQYSTQWHLHSNLNPATANEPGIRAEGAWDVAKGTGSVIAVVDNGVTSHSDLNGKLLPGQDFGNFVGGNGYGMNLGFPNPTCQVMWHGTHVSGIAAALTNNGIGVAGVAPDAKVVSARVLGACGTGPMSSVVDGITWSSGGTVPGIPANANPAKVINLSLAALGQCQQTLQSAIDDATSRGAIVVVAAGNDNKDASAAQPANCRNVITVGGSAKGARWDNSNYGPVVDVAAPAFYIWSTLDSGTSTPSGETYGYMSGTSMATPMVSGVIALAQSVAPKALTVAEYRALLQQSVQPFTQQPDQAVGPGIIDATKTVTAAKSGYIPVAADFSCTQDGTPFMQIVCSDLSSARGGTPIKTRKWDTGSLTPSRNGGSGDPQTFRYKYSGTYPITLTVTDNNGGTSTFTRPVSVSPPPTISLNPNVAVTYSGNSSDGAYYQTLVPTGATSVTFTVNLANAGESIWLYASDTPSTYDPVCSTRGGGPGPVTCTVNNPRAGNWYGILSVSSKTVTGATVTASYK